MDIADEYLGDAACGQEKGRVELCWKVLLAHASAFLQFNSTQPVSFFFRSSLACVRIRTIRTDSDERGRSIKCIVFPNGRGRLCLYRPPHDTHFRAVFTECFIRITFICIRLVLF